MDFADAINQIQASMEGNSWQIEGLAARPDLSGFDEQETDMPLFPVEYVRQNGGGDYSGYYGDIYFPTTYPDGDGVGVLFLHITYHEK